MKWEILLEERSKEMIKPNSYTLVTIVLIMLIFTSTIKPSWSAGSDIKREQNEIRRMVQNTLSYFYSLNPSAKETISKAAGYAVFSNFGMKIFFAGGGKGKGMVVDNKTGKETFMRMLEVQAGIGFGAKKFKLIWVFETRKGLNDFINMGWELGGQTTVAAKKGDEGSAFAGALAIAPGVWLYQITDTGLAAELTAKGTRYYKDKELNK
jgi:lipid-binding SYLF domain-containing protein